MTLKSLIKHQLFHKSSSILYLSILASCTTLNSIDELPNNEYENIDESRFYVSNPNENLETTYKQCLEKSNRQIKIENIATRGAGGTIALSGIGAIASGLAAAAAAVPVSVGLIVVGASTIATGEVSKEYRGDAKVQKCLEQKGYDIVFLRVGK